MVNWVADFETTGSNQFPAWARRSKSADLYLEAFDHVAGYIGTALENARARFNSDRDKRDFEGLNDRTLKDIGIARSDVHCMAYGPCGKLAPDAKVDKALSGKFACAVV